MRNLLKCYLPSSLVVIFCLFALLGAAKSTDKKTGKSADTLDKPIMVNVTKVASSNIPDIIDALGGLSATKTVVISAETAGRIEGINFKDGQSVGQGMPIVQLDNQQVQASYNSAVTEYHLAQQKYQRAKLLVNEAISKQALAVLAAAVATKQAAVQSELANLNQKQVSAPFAGVLGSFNKQVGDYVKAGDPLVALVNSEQLLANYNLPEKDLPKLKTGQLVKVMTSAYPKKIFYGTVTFISPSVSSDSRMVAVQAEIDNKKGLLSPGMFVHVQQQIGQITAALIIPADAITADIKGYFVYLVDGNKAVKQYIKTGIHEGANTQVISGLELGQTIVSAGQQKLEDGSTIQISGQGSST